MAGFFLTLRHAGWHPGAYTGPGSPLNYAYRQATTVAWLGIVSCQVGTAFAVRTDHASLRQVGVFSNKLLLGAIAVALAFAAALVYLPVMHGLFGTASLSPGQLAIVAPFPFIVWGTDEIRRALVRRHRPRALSADLRPAAARPTTLAFRLTRDEAVERKGCRQGDQDEDRQGRHVQASGVCEREHVVP